VCLQYFDAVGWVLRPVKNRRPYNLYCVGGDVKPCSLARCKVRFRFGHGCWSWRSVMRKYSGAGLQFGWKINHCIYVQSFIYLIVPVYWTYSDSGIRPLPADRRVVTDWLTPISRNARCCCYQLLTYRTFHVWFEFWISQGNRNVLWKVKETAERRQFRTVLQAWGRA